MSSLKDRQLQQGHQEETARRLEALRAEILARVLPDGIRPNGILVKNGQQIEINNAPKPGFGSHRGTVRPAQNRLEQRVAHKPANKVRGAAFVPA
jgi:hypothetical protein